jgi:hypothetical protein
MSKNQLLVLFFFMLAGYSALSQPNREDLENAIEVAFRHRVIARCVYATPAGGVRKAVIYANDLFVQYFPGPYSNDGRTESFLGDFRKKAEIYVMHDGLIYGEADVITTLVRMDISASVDTIQLELLTSPIKIGAYPCKHATCTLERKKGVWKVMATDVDKVKCDKSKLPPYEDIVDLR